MALKDCIQEIIAALPQGAKFDSHTVINALCSKKEYYETYMQEFAQQRPASIKDFHKKIADTIKQVLGTESIAEVYSKTVYNNITANRLWQKQ